MKGYLSHSEGKINLVVVVGRRRSTRTPAPPLLSTRPSGMSRRRRRAFAALFAALCVSRVVLVCGSADDASSRTAPADGAESHLSSRLRDIAADVEANADYVIRLRRELHLVPELMWTEVKTSAIVKRELDAMGIAHADLSPPGVLATIGTGAPPVVLLRADMDALPITEASDIPPERRSAHPGRMHACGHDGHVAMLLGAARALKSRESTLSGTVHLAFQPAEEGGAGARRMLEERLADARPPIETSFALHNWPYPETPSGVVATRPGVIMAGSAAFEIVVVGVGGHAAKPAELVDVVACVAAIVTASQTIISRRVDPLDGALVTITAVDAGDVRAENVAADRARMLGQLHATRESTMASARRALATTTSAAAAAHGCEATVDFAPVTNGARREAYPPTVNDPRAAALAAEVAATMFGAESGAEAATVMPAEDFAFFAGEWPSAMAWIGAYDESKGAVWPLHSAKYVLDESTLARGAAMHAGYAVAFLAGGGFETSETHDDAR